MSQLHIEINSFSYRKGYPKELAGNGGGYVFDCRGIHNPGREEEFKTQSGLDEGVQNFIDENTEMHRFLSHIFKILDISITEYLNRGFTNLQINYGCTGGQHRSVYASEKTADYIQQEYPDVKVTLNHTNQQNWPK